MVDDVAPVAVEYVPSEHDVHACDPDDCLYSPALHAVHVPPLAPVYPALHTQAVIAELPEGAAELAGQARHVTESVAPTVVE